jgi:hypothetical protein
VTAQLIREERPTFRSPLSTRRYLTAHSAYVAWAKAIIFAKCECVPGNEISPFVRCKMHDRLFTALGNEYDGEPREYESNERYLLVRDRLVRWLKWRATRCP